MDISYKKAYLENLPVNNCTTFDELTPNAFFERVVLDLATEAGRQEARTTSQIFMSFKEEVEDPGARVWFDLLEDNNYAGLRIRAIQTSNQDVTEKLIKFAQELSDDRQNNSGRGSYDGTLSRNNTDYADLFTPATQYQIYEGTKVVDFPLSQALEAGSTYIEQREENAAIIKSFEMNINLGENAGEYFPPSANQGNEHLSYFVYVYIDLSEAAETYGLDLNLRNTINSFPYGQISFINVLGQYKTGLEMSETRSGPGKRLLCDLRQLRKFRQRVSPSTLLTPDAFSAIRGALGNLTERLSERPFRNQRGILLVADDPNTEDIDESVAVAREDLVSAREIDKLTGDQGYFTEFWHSKDQKDNIRFIFGLDYGRLAIKNCSYPMLLKNSRLRELSGVGNLIVFELKDMKVKKIRLREDSKGTTALGGNTRFDIFDEKTDYIYVAGVKDTSNPIYRDNRARLLEGQLERASESSDVRFFSGKDNLKNHSTEPGTYNYRVESTFLDNSPRIIKGLAKRLDRQAHILRRAHNQLAGRHVFNEEFTQNGDQPGAVATRTMGGFFLREEGTNLVIQEQTFSNIREAVEPAANIVADIADEMNILSGFVNERAQFSLKQVIQYLVSAITPDATGLSLTVLEEITGFTEYLAAECRRSVNQALVNFTSDEYKGTASSGTGSDVVGGKRIIKDTHNFSEIVNNLKTKKTGIDLVSWWEQNDQDKGLKGYDYSTYIRRVNGEVAKFYTEGSAPSLTNLWTYMTPALIKVAGREPVNPYILGGRTRPSMYSYEEFANFHADLYDYKFNSKHTQPYHLYEATYSEHDKTKDRMRPDTYQNKTIKQILNQHCEIEISAIDEKYRDESGKPKLKKSDTSTSVPDGGIYRVFGAPDGTADETTAASVEAAFGDLAAQKKKIIEDYHVSVTSKEPKTFVPKVTRIFYTLMGEMVLTPSPAEYADARYNSFAGIEDQIADDTGSAVRAIEIAAQAERTQQEYQERQERRREDLEQAEDTVERRRRDLSSEANRLHEEDIRENRRSRDQDNNEPYPVPSLMERIDPLYNFGSFGSWHPVLLAERDGEITRDFLDRVRALPTQEERVDAICELWLGIQARRRANRDPNNELVSNRHYRSQIEGICNTLRPRGRTRQARADIERLTRELAEQPPDPATFGDIRDVGPRMRGLPIQLQALTDMANYIAGGQMGDGARNALPYNQPVLTGEPYTEIPIDKSMLAISDINGNTVTLANVYDVMKDHSKFAPFWYNFKHIYEIQYLAGFDNNIRAPIWAPLTEQIYVQDANTGEVNPTLCRVVSYDNDSYGVKGLGTTSLPVYNKYFFLESEKDVSLPPDVKDFGRTDFGGPFVIDPTFTPGEIVVPEFTPDLPPGISTTPRGGIDFGNDTGFFGGIPAAGFTTGDFSNIEFDFVEATGSGIINPRTNINTVVNSLAVSPNVTSAVTANVSNIAAGVTANVNFNGSGY
tara:strand:- start:1624 stop:6015 length:4392 start_codon:yes stop_codon:yes gene_type:complete